MNGGQRPIAPAAMRIKGTLIDQQIMFEIRSQQKVPSVEIESVASWFSESRRMNSGKGIKPANQLTKP
jgi:hypothetical protein